MADPSETTEFKDFLAAMPQIAEAVKAFPEAIQGQAFDAIMAQLQGSTRTQPPPVPDASTSAGRRGSANKKSPTPPSGSPRARRSAAPTLVKDLDLAPKGKKSLKAFVDEKKPKTQLEQNTLSVYYLAEVLGLPAVSVDHVFTCYKDMKWREPGDLANSLAKTAHDKRWLDTSNLTSIKLTPPGRNLIEHDLPAAKKAK